MITADLYRMAGISTWIALVALVLSGIALALFFAGAGAFWGPVNDALIVVTAFALLPGIVAVARLAGDHAAPWVAILTVAAIAGLVLVAVGQTLLIVGRLSLEGSFVTFGLGTVPFLAWVVLVAVLGLGGSAVPESVGRLAAVVLGTIVVAAILGVVGSGPVLWIAGIGTLVALSIWLAGLATSLGDRAAVA